jgi:hypothetical protein
VAPLDIEPQPRKRLQQPGIERSHLAVPYVMRVKGLVIKTRGRAKRAHDAREVVFVFLSDVLIDDLKTGRSYSIFGIHGHPLAMRCAGRLDASRHDGQPSAPPARRPFWSLISAAATVRFKALLTESR